MLAQRRRRARAAAGSTASSPVVRIVSMSARDRPAPRLRELGDVGIAIGRVRRSGAREHIVEPGRRVDVVGERRHGGAELRPQHLGRGRAGERRPAGECLPRHDPERVLIRRRRRGRIAGLLRARVERRSRRPQVATARRPRRRRRRRGPRCRSRRGSCCRPRRTARWRASRRGARRPSAWAAASAPLSSSTTRVTSASGNGPSAMRSASEPPRRSRNTRYAPPGRRQ